VVEKPVEDRGGQHLVTEDLAPFTEGLVGGQDDRALFVTLGDHLEDEIRLRSFQWLVTDLVHHQDTVPSLLVKAACGFGGREVADHVVKAGEVDRVAGPTGRDGEGDGDVGLQVGRAERRSPWPR